MHGSDARVSAGVRDGCGGAAASRCLRAQRRFAASIDMCVYASLARSRMSAMGSAAATGLLRVSLGLFAPACAPFTITLKAAGRPLT